MTVDQLWGTFVDQSHSQFSNGQTSEEAREDLRTLAVRKCMQMYSKMHGEECGLILQEVATIAGMFLADKVGRRQMLIQTTVQSLIAQAVLAGILARFTDSDTIQMGPVPSKAAIILVRLETPAIL